MIGGFLGAGKTTTIARLAHFYQSQGKHVCIVTNDQAADLVDTELLRSFGYEVAEVAGSCFCCNFNGLTEAMDTFEKRRRPDVILASNTSSLSITTLGAATNRPDRVLGMHFMNPGPLMSLVELIRGQATSPESMLTVAELCIRLNKTAVEASDYPGFIANRVLMPMVNEAIFAVMEGVGTADAIDTVMKLGMNHPMGPLTLADFIGLDVCLAILEVLHEGLCDPKYRPCPLLRRMVAAGHLGRKSGQGFYAYPPQ